MIIAYTPVALNQAREEIKTSRKTDEPEREREREGKEQKQKAYLKMTVRKTECSHLASICG